MKWTKANERALQGKIWRVRFHEHGTHSINPLDFIGEEGPLLKFKNGIEYLKSNVEWLDESPSPQQTPVSGWSDEDMRQAFQAGANKNGPAFCYWLDHYKPTPSSGQQEGYKSPDISGFDAQIPLGQPEGEVKMVGIGTQSGGPIITDQPPSPINKANEDYKIRADKLAELSDTLRDELKAKDSEVKKLVTALEEFAKNVKTFMGHESPMEAARIVDKVEVVLQPYIQSNKTD
jgi:hypothetical protein